jgi:acetyl esterase/lipase
MTFRMLAAGAAIAAVWAGRPGDPADGGPGRFHAVREVFDIAYSDSGPGVGDERRLNLFLPEAEQPFPFVLWIHGGAWITGDRSEETGIARRFAERGVGVAAVGYRLSAGTWLDPAAGPGVRHPAHAKDCARAFAWLRRHAASYGGDPDRIVVAGYSSGGHLAALLATDARYLEAEGLTLDAVRAAVPIAGIYDLEAYYRAHLEARGERVATGHVLDVFGPGVEDLRDASPTAHVGDSRVPMLVVSEYDTYRYTLRLVEAAETAGRKGVEFLHVLERDHRSLYRGLGREKDGTRDRVVEYVRRVTGGGD